MAPDMLLVVSALLVAVTLALVIVMRYYQDKLARLRDDVEAAGVARKRTAIAASRLTEWAPFLARYPYDPRNFRAIGGPIDGIQIEQDRVVLVRFGSPDRPGPDARVRDLVLQGRVEWLDFPLEGPGPGHGPGPGTATNATTPTLETFRDDGVPPPPPPAPPPAGPPP